MIFYITSLKKKKNEINLLFVVKKYPQQINKYII